MLLNDVDARVLLVEDSPSNAVVYRSYLDADYEVKVAQTGREALACLKDQQFDVLISDVRLPDMSGLDILDHVQEHLPDLPVIVITAHGSMDLVVDAMQRGASDFISKPFDKARLDVTLRNILKKQHLEDVVHQYEKSFARDRFHRMIGASLPMQSVYRIVESAAKSRASVFITGESGTGKELCSEALHNESVRKDKPFVAINCAAIPRELIESEIFGHVKGAFTGAASAREGAALRASGGTLFLDEIGEMPMELQSKLLRFIQTGSFQPLGSNKEIKVDVRFLCATNRDPLVEVQEGRFREDLYYRLHVIPVQMPALRERGQDILLIARELLKQFADDEEKSFVRFSRDVEALFLGYSWPGNVRELSNVIRNIVVLNDGDTVEISMMPAALNEAASKKQVSRVDPPAVSVMPGFQSNVEPTHEPLQTQHSEQAVHSERDIVPLWLEEKRIIESAIEKCAGNVPRAAAFLEISASTIYRKKQQWDKLAANAGSK